MDSVSSIEINAKAKGVRGIKMERAEIGQPRASLVHVRFSVNAASAGY
jgi:hypothetical protein